METGTEKKQSSEPGTDPRTLEDFLNKFPWDKEALPAGLQNRPRLDFLWEFELPVSPRQLWPHLIDTSQFNKLLGLPKMNYEEREGRLYGQTRNAGIMMRWEEVPWQWEFEQTLSNARIYSEGFARFVRSRYWLTPLEDGSKTRLLVYFGWIPRGVRGRLILKLGMGSLRSSYAKALNHIVGLIGQAESFSRQQQALQRELDTHSFSPEATGRLEKAEGNLKTTGLNPAAIDALFAFILEASNEELLRVRPRRLAADWNLPETDVVRAFLHATREGILKLSWDVVCPHCRGTRETIRHLGDLPESASCDVCEIDFDPTSLNTIEITFQVHPSVRPVEKQLFCAAEPAKKRHIFYRRELSPGQSEVIASNLEAGRYRMRTEGERTYHIVDVRPENPRGEFRHVLEANGKEGRYQVSPRPLIQLENQLDRPATLVLEQNEEDNLVLRPADLFHYQDFYDLFSEEALASGMDLDIGNQTILFTDVVGSSAMYEVEGDAGAFRRVRSHFVAIYDIVRKHDGAVIKTIGDAAMAAFASPAPALEAALDMQTLFTGKHESGLRLRYSIHAGPCLAVNLDSNIDFFGRTVNLAAKLQSMAGDGEIILSEPVFQEPGSQKLLRRRQINRLYKREFRKWWQGNEEITVYRLPPPASNG